MGKPRQHLSQIVARRHKADVYAGQKQYQTDIGINQTDQDSRQVSARKLQDQCLEHCKKQHDRKQGQCDFFHICGKLYRKQVPQLL